MTPDSIMAADDARCIATVALDLPRLALLYSDQLIWVHSSAVVDTKASLIQRFADGSARCHQLEASETSVRIAGSVGIMTGIMLMDAEWAGVRKAAQSRFTAIWTESNAGQQLMSWHSCRIP